MATLRQKIECEQRMRALLADNDLPDPDRVEYGHTCIRLFFHPPNAPAPGTCVVVDIDQPPGDAA